MPALPQQQVDSSNPSHKIRGDSTLPTPGAPSLCEAPQGEWGANVSLQADPFQPACIVLRSVGQVP